MVPQDELAVSDQSHKAAEAAMLDWYNEWAGIARRVIPNRNVLRSLGLNRRPSTRDLEADELDESLALPAGSPIEVRTLPPVVDAPKVQRPTSRMSTRMRMQPSDLSRSPRTDQQLNPPSSCSRRRPNRSGR